MNKEREGESYIIVILWSKLILTAINVDTIIVQTNKDLFSKNYCIN